MHVVAAPPVRAALVVLSLGLLVACSPATSDTSNTPAPPGVSGLQVSGPTPTRPAPTLADVISYLTLQSQLSGGTLSTTVQVTNSDSAPHTLSTVQANFYDVPFEQMTTANTPEHLVATGKLDHTLTLQPGEAQTVTITAANPSGRHVEVVGYGPSTGT